jgi:hypothetical protein
MFHLLKMVQKLLKNKYFIKFKLNMNYYVIRTLVFHTFYLL